MKITCRLKKEYKEKAEVFNKGKWTEKPYGWGNINSTNEHEYEIRYRLEIYGIHPDEDYSNTLVSFSEYFTHSQGGRTDVWFFNTGYAYLHDSKQLFCTTLEREI